MKNTLLDTGNIATDHNILLLLDRIETLEQALRKKEDETLFKKLINFKSWKKNI